MFDGVPPALRMWGALLGVVAALGVALVSWHWSNGVDAIAPIPDELVADLSMSKALSAEAIKAAAKECGAIPVVVVPRHDGAQVHAGVADPAAFCQRLASALADAQVSIQWVTMRAGQETGHGHVP